MEVDDALIKLITQIHGDTKSEDGTRVQSRANRTKLLELARQLVFLLEPPEDWIINQAFMSVINFAIRVLVELNVFKLLTKADGATMTVSQLASSTSTDELLLTRCLRAACGVNFVDEVGVSEYRANKVTKALTMPGLEAGYQMIFDNQMRPKSLLWACLDYFREGGFVNPESATAGPLQIANDCVGWTAFDFWFSDPYPEEATRFSTVSHDSRTPHDSVYSATANNLFPVDASSPVAPAHYGSNGSPSKISFQKKKSDRTNLSLSM